MVSIPRVIFGPHLAGIGVTLLVCGGRELDLYGKEPVVIAIVTCLALILLVRPRFVLTSKGLYFGVRILFFTFTYASIPRDRILSIQVAWEREDVVGSAGKVAYAYRRPFLGIFLEYLWNDPPTPTTMHLRSPKNKTVGRKEAARYAEALGCPLRVM